MMISSVKRAFAYALLITSFMTPSLTYSAIDFSLANASNNTWNFQIAPYLWAINMNGRTQIGTRIVHIDQNFNDILSELNWGGMLWLEAAKGDVGLYANALYAALSSDEHQGVFTANAKNNYGIFGAGASYDIYKKCISSKCTDLANMFVVSPYVGLRYNVNNTTITFNAPGLSLRGSENQNWTDPIIGAKLHYYFTKALTVMVAGDLGGTNTSNNYTYSATALLGYKPQTMLSSTSFYLGYRVLDQYYVTGSGRHYYKWDAKIFGPLVGVAFTF